MFFSTQPASRENWVEHDQLQDLSKLGACQGNEKWISSDRIQGEFVSVTKYETTETNLAFEAISSINESSIPVEI